MGLFLRYQILRYAHHILWAVSLITLGIAVFVIANDILSTSYITADLVVSILREGGATSPLALLLASFILYVSSKLLGRLSDDTWNDLVDAIVGLIESRRIISLEELAKHVNENTRTVEMLLGILRREEEFKGYIDDRGLVHSNPPEEEPYIIQPAGVMPVQRLEPPISPPEPPPLPSEGMGDTQPTQYEALEPEPGQQPLKQTMAGLQPPSSHETTGLEGGGSETSPAPEYTAVESAAAETTKVLGSIEQTRIVPSEAENEATMISDTVDSPTRQFSPLPGSDRNAKRKPGRK